MDAVPKVLSQLVVKRNVCFATIVGVWSACLLRGRDAGISERDSRQQIEGQKRSAHVQPPCTVRDLSTKSNVTNSDTASYTLSTQDNVPQTCLVIWILSTWLLRLIITVPTNYYGHLEFYSMVEPVSLLVDSLLPCTQMTTCIVVVMQNKQFLSPSFPVFL